MKKFRKTIAFILAAVMLTVYMPMAECHAAGATEYTSATNMEFNKLYFINLKANDEYTGERNYIWYTFTPKTLAETKVEILQTVMTGFYLDVAVFDDLIQEVKIRDNKLDLKKDATYYLRLTGSYRRDGEVSFMLKTTGTDNSNENNPSNPSNQTPGNSTDNTPGSDSTNNNPGTDPGSDSANNNPGNNNQGNNSDIGDVDSDFWNGNDNNGSDVYDGELPVPEISDVENGNSSITVSWSCDDSDSIDGYYVYRSKDGNNWNKIATITDTEVMDYEDRDIVEGDACGYIVCSFAGSTRSENSVPEYTCFLKKVSIKSVKSNASKKLTVKWTTSPKASGYQIRVSTTKSFTTTTTDTQIVNSASSSAKTISKLKGGRKYYVQIRTYRTYNGERYYSEWSPTKSVKVKK